jgi:hypothetical protein
MPNWCYNKLKITGKKEDVDNVLNAIKGPGIAFDFNKVKPYPWRFAVIDRKSENNKSKTPIKDGFNSGGYEWCCSNWGTKWNALHQSEVKRTRGNAYMEFDTAWAPPIPIMKILIKKYPNVEFELEFSEEGDGFRGAMGPGGEVHMEKE